MFDKIMVILKFDFEVSDVLFQSCALSYA